MLVAAAICTVPAGHAPAGVQEDWLGPEVYVPLGHAAQVRSTEDDGVLLVWLPAAQVVQELQAASFVPVVKVPLAQPAQVRSELAVPAASTWLPGEHTVHAAQLA